MDNIQNYVKFPRSFNFTQHAISYKKTGHKEEGVDTKVSIGDHLEEYPLHFLAERKKTGRNTMSYKPDSKVVANGMWRKEKEYDGIKL